VAPSRPGPGSGGAEARGEIRMEARLPSQEGSITEERGEQKTARPASNDVAVPKRADVEVRHSWRPSR